MFLDKIYINTYIFFHRLAFQTNGRGCCGMATSSMRIFLLCFFFTVAVVIFPLSRAPRSIDIMGLMGEWIGHGRFKYPAKSQIGGWVSLNLFINRIEQARGKLGQSWVEHISTTSGRPCGENSELSFPYTYEYRHTLTHRPHACKWYMGWRYVLLVMATSKSYWLENTHTCFYHHYKRFILIILLSDVSMRILRLNM